MKYLLITMLISASYSFGRSEIKTLDSLKAELTMTQEEIKQLNSRVHANDLKLTNTIIEVKTNLAAQSTTLKDLVNEKDKALREQVKAIYDSLVINTARVTANDTKFKTEQTKSEKNFLYSVIGILMVLILLIIIYLLTQKRAKSIEQKAEDLDTSTQQLKKQLSELSTTTSEEFASTLEKFASILNGQPTTSADPDHSMVMEFAKQIVTMENNLSRMDLEDKGWKKIKKSIDKMHITLKTMNYEITSLLGKNIIEGKTIDIDIREEDENIELGKQIVYNVVRAEILFKGKQIQKAKVDVKYNPND